MTTTHQDARLARALDLARKLDPAHRSALVAALAHDQEDPAELLPLTRAADLLGVVPATLRIQARNGKLAVVKRGRDLYVSRGDLERYRVERLGTRRPSARTKAAMAAIESKEK